MASCIELLEGIQQGIIASGLFTTTTCTYAFDPMLVSQKPPDDKFLVIQPNRLEVKQQAWAKGPARNYIYCWHAILHLFVRYNVDEAGREESYLFDQTLGSVQLVDSIIDVLQNYVSEGGWGYTLDDVAWPDDSHDNIGWAVTRLNIRTDLTGRSAEGN
jgi:hypothetical protein